MKIIIPKNPVQRLVNKKLYDFQVGDAACVMINGSCGKAVFMKADSSVTGSSFMFCILAGEGWMVGEKRASCDNGELFIPLIDGSPEYEDTPPDRSQEFTFDQLNRREVFSWNLINLDMGPAVKSDNQNYYYIKSGEQFSLATGHGSELVTRWPNATLDLSPKKDSSHDG